jgi:hypothetical protein
MAGEGTRGAKGSEEATWSLPSVDPKIPSQRLTVKLLALIIDAARAERSTRSRERLHRALGKWNWRTNYVLHNLGAGRCRYLAQLGYPIPPRYLSTRPLGRSIR